MNLSSHIPSELLHFFSRRAFVLSAKTNARSDHIFIAMVRRQLTAFTPAKIDVKLFNKTTEVEDDDLYGPTKILRYTYTFEIDGVGMFVLFNQSVPEAEDDDSGFTLNVHFNTVTDTEQKYALTKLNHPFEVFSALSIAFGMYRKAAEHPVKNIILYVQDPSPDKKKLHVFYAMLLRELNKLRYSYKPRLSKRESAIVIEFAKLTKL